MSAREDIAPAPHGDAGSIAIVGLAGRFPGARSAAELWSLLREGKEATEWPGDEALRAAGVPAEDLQDPDYVRASLVLPDMEMFDAEFFGFSKRDAAILDPQHRHFLECAWEALEDSGHLPETFAGAIGVFAGCGMQSYLSQNLLTNPGLVKSVGRFLLRHTGNDKDFLCSRLSYLLDLKGPSITIQTACSTSLVAVHVAAQSLLAGECDMALAGGVSIELPHRQGYRFAQGEILSPDGHCRAFDEGAAGTLFGSGAAIVVLRRLEDAARDGDNIYAVIRGSAVNNDGAQKAGYLAPSVDGQARAAVEALAVAGVDPASVAYIEAHGTGTPVGDPIEIAALAQAYGGAAAGTCGIGSVKTNIGHLDTAAGAASLIKVALALRHGLIPASLNFSRPNSRLEIHKTPFYVMDSARPWTRGTAPRRAAVNSLGVGGTNAHVIVEEPPAGPAAAGEAQWQVFALSARTPASLAGLQSKWLDFLGDTPADFDAANAAYTTQSGRKAFAHRCAIVARDAAGLREALRAPGHPRRVTAQTRAEAPGVAFMFPGGGAHYPGAGRELLTHTAFARAVDACFAAMPAAVPGDLRRVMFECGPADTGAQALLERPAYAMPALFTLEYAIAALWESWGIRPVSVIGHSAGEYTAACLAGVMSLADALALVVLRGELFEAAPAGGMVSVDLPEAQLQGLLEGLDLDIGAVNAPDLCIVSGALPSLAQFETRLAAQGLAARRLRINVAAHSRLLDGVLARFQEFVARIRLNAPSIPYVSTLTGTWADARELTDPKYWVRHLREPVRFADGLGQLLAQPDTILIEAGPGQGLCALARQNGLGRPRTILPSTGKADDQGSDVAAMLAAAGALWTRGRTPDWSTMRGAARPRRTSIPTYAFEHQRHWVEPGLQAQPALPATAEPLRPAGHALRRLPFEEWFRVPAWSPAPLEPRAPSGAHQWLVLGSNATLTTDIAAQAVREGAAVTVARRGERYARHSDGSFALDPADAGQFTSMLAALEQEGRLPDRIVHLWALDTVPVAPSGQLAGQALAFDSLMHLAQALQEIDLREPLRLTIVTAGSQAVDGEAVPHPERALALGPCRVLPHEMPHVSARLVDLASFDISSVAASRAIVREAGHPDENDLVAWRGGERWVCRLVKAKPGAPGAMPAVRDGGVYLVTGGLGDIALELAGFLAGKKARLALVSRRALPLQASWRGLAASGDCSPEVRLIRRLLALEDLGARILTFSADVADRDAMARVVAECRFRFGAVHGVFHCAGVLEDGPIATKSAESVRRVLDPKARGAQVLHELLPPGDLDLFAVFSSASVYLGTPGQADYVAANAFLDALAASRPDGLSIHWGIWGDTGMAARTYGADIVSNAGTMPVHPLLGVQVDSVNGAAFEACYAPADLWVLQEHCVAGRPVLPGTAYIEIARAAMNVLHPGAAVEIRSLSFEEAMVFDAQAPRRVRIELRRGGERYDFVVRSRGQGENGWQEHARAGVCIFSGSLAPAAPLPAGAWRKGEIPQEQAVAFGPRWNNIARMRLGSTGAVAELELAQRFSGDLAVYSSHPALTDMASTFGLHLIDPAERANHLFVPMSIQRIRLVAPVPREATSRVALTGPTGNRLAAFDISLHASDGSPIATFEGFSLRGVQPAAVSHQMRERREPALTDAMLACGIKAADAHALFARIFAGAGRDILVSSIAVDELQRAMQAATPKVAARKADSPVDIGPAALNPVELVIADAWRELLGVEEVLREDDFFALGGHSLAAIRLFARIRKQFAVDLPLATLFETPTLAALAALVAQNAGLDTAEPSTAGQKREASNVIALGTRAWSPLVTICRGNAMRPPLFCVHGAGGNVLNFKIISDGLGPEQPFYGLQAQGVDGRLPALPTIEAMAAQYVEAIRTVDPHGPYQLAGYSAGGVIALEMAQQLKKAGAQVALLAMIDTLMPGAARHKVSRWKKLWLARHWSVGFAVGWPARRRRSQLMNIQYAQALEKLSRGEPLQPEMVEFHLFRNFMAAQERYEPEPYQGRVVLFKASQADTQYLFAGDMLGWENRIHGGIRVAGVPGSHKSMMAEPGLSKLIAVLREELGLGEDSDSWTPPRSGPLPVAGKKSLLPLGTWFTSVRGR